MYSNEGARMKKEFQTFGFGMPWEEAYGFSQALLGVGTGYVTPAAACGRGVRAGVAGGPEVATSWRLDALFGCAVALVVAPRVLLIVRPRGGRLVEAR
jgi:hypothetical protein